MKRAIYLLAATALMASCTQSEVLVDTPNPVPEVPRSIGFDTFVDKATRATGENSTALNDFYPAFNVYGWKTVGEETTQVFEDITVNYYDAEGTAEDGYTPGKEWGEDVATGWYYDYVRYWDNMATAYQFSAFTPAQAKGVTCTENGTITIGTDKTPITVDPMNLLAERPQKELAFTGFKYDYMTATSKVAASPVTLNFQHLQAKLNIRIRLAESITTAQDVRVMTVAVHNLCDKGYYTNEEGVGVTGWQTAEPSSDYVPMVNKGFSLNTTKADDNFNNHYVLEQLIIPQTIKASTGEAPALSEYPEACIYVEYKIGEEMFKSYSPLANIFSTEDTYNFEGGKQYTLNITVGPAPIEFTAEVTSWKEGTEAEHKMD